VLVVEHEPQVLRVVKEILARAGFDVLQARSSARALRICEQHRSTVDLLLVDCSRREFEEIARKFPELKILGLSGASGAEFAGRLQVVQMPFTPSALVDAVHSALHSPASRG
jgi:CheY-like chemotaxis protein